VVYLLRHEEVEDMSQSLLKIAISLAVILLCTEIGKRVPSLAGLVAVMPLTSLLVLIWLYLENRGDPAVMIHYTKGAFWGILPSILFFLAAYLCFKKDFGLPVVLSASVTVWLVGAVIHQWLLR